MLTRSVRQSAEQAAPGSSGVLAQALAGAPGWLIRTAAMSSPERKRAPIQNMLPADDALSPTVGAKCRRYHATYARGWLIMDGDRSTSSGPGSRSEQNLERTRVLPRFGALRGDNTPSPALRGLVQACSLSCMLEEEDWAGLALLLLLAMRVCVVWVLNPLHG